MILLIIIRIIIIISAPKVQHIKRASPCYDNEHVLKFDDLLRTAISIICNVSLTDDQWLQANLLKIKSGGLEFRRVSSLASLAFLASAVGTRDLQNQILHMDMIMLDSALDICQTLWQERYGQFHNLISPAKQQTWDIPSVEREITKLTERQINNYDKAILLASTSKHSGD